MRTLCLRVFLVIAATLLLVSEEGYTGNLALAQSPDFSNAAARRDKQCPSSPDNVPSTLLKKISGDTLQQGIRVVGDTLIIEGTANPDHILIKGGRPAGVVRIIFDGKKLGSFGPPVARIVVRAGDGNDVVIVKPQVVLPARLEGGAGDDCLQGGSGPDLLFGEEGNDLLIGSASRDALNTGPGKDRLVIPRQMGAISVGPSATGDALRILAGGYRLRPISAGATAGPVIVGAADLDDVNIVDLLKRFYSAGHTVSLANATANDAALLPSLLGHQGGATWDSAHPRMDLVSFRKATRPDGRTHFITEMVAPRKVVSSPRDLLEKGEQLADLSVIESLSQTFAETPVVPDPPPGDDSANLLQLADSYQSKGIGSDNSTGNVIQLVNQVWAARSFLNQFDLYYILQELDTSQGAIDDLRSWSNSAGAFPGFSGQTIIDTSPESTLTTTTVTSGISESIGGNVGVNAAQGPIVTGSAGVTISNSKTIVVPPIQITNQTDIEIAAPGWLYKLNQLLDSGESITVWQNWIWEVPFSVYAAGQKTYPFAALGSMLLDFRDNPNYELDTPQINATVPLPFGDTFKLEKPVVLSVSPTCVNAGNPFTITGTGLYPTLVTGVLIGGTPLDSSEYTPASNTSITVVAPEMSGEALPVVVQTTQGESDSNVTIEISVIDICNL